MRKGAIKQQPDVKPNDEIKKRMLEIINSVPSWATGAIGLLIGSLVGHWLGIERDKRKQRADTFNSQRALIVSAPLPVKVSAAEEDALLNACRRTRRKRLRVAIDQCNTAARGYYEVKDEAGQRFSSVKSEQAMRQAIEVLANELRHI